MVERANDIESAVVAMYTRHPSPSRKDKVAFADRRMSLRLRCCGIEPEHYVGRDFLDAGCGTGEYACWFASHGARVTGIDLSDGSLREAREYAAANGLDAINFEKRSVLDTGFPDEHFDFIYCTGVLHHTHDPFGGLTELFRILRPGGRILISLYNPFGMFAREVRRLIAKMLGGKDLTKRVLWGRRLFPLTARRLTRSSYNDAETALFDYFAIPHETLHSLGEVILWFERLGLRYTGCFPPGRLRDYLPMVASPEYQSVEKAYQFGPGSLLAPFGNGKPIGHQRPGPLSRMMVQTLWMSCGVNIISVSALKPENRTP